MNERASGTLDGDTLPASTKVAANKQILAPSAKFGHKLGRKETPVGKAMRIICPAAGCTYTHALRCYYGERTGSPATMQIIANVMKASGLPEKGVRRG